MLHDKKNISLDNFGNGYRLGLPQEDEVNTYHKQKFQRQLNILKNSRRIASQFNEQVTTNLGSKIEFDLRLTDTEDVLERYRYLSEKHRKSIKIFQ